MYQFINSVHRSPWLDDRITAVKFLQIFEILQKEASSGSRGRDNKERRSLERQKYKTGPVSRKLDFNLQIQV